MWKIGNVKIDNRIVCAPLAGVSNIATREINKSMGVGLIYSEMVSALGLIYDGKKTLDLIKINESERPISIQLFGDDAESMARAAKIVYEKVKPDIIDINMGCPVPKVAVKSHAGSSLMKDTSKIREIVSSVVKSVPIPITVKIRTGWNKSSINAVEVAKICEECGAKAIAIHGRTREQGYSGSVDIETIKRVKESVKIPVIANGDIKTIEDAKNMLDFTKCDAIMIGRKALGNPWFLRECLMYIENNSLVEEPTYKERLDMIFKHYELLKKHFSERVALLEIKSHALWYLKYIPNSKEIKTKITQIKSEEELIEILKNFEKTL